MDTGQKKKIQKNLVFIKDNMTDVVNVVDHLIQREIFSLEQRSDIVKDNATSRDTCQKLIDCLIKSGPAAYDHFLFALQETNNGYLVERLNDTNIEAPILQKAFVDGIEKEKTLVSLGNKTLTLANIELSVQSGCDANDSTKQLNMVEMNETVQRLEQNMIQMKEETNKRMEQNLNQMAERDEKLGKAISSLHKEVKLYREKSVELAEVNSKLIYKDEQYSTLQTALIKLKEQLEDGRQRLENRNKQNIQQTKRIEELEADIDTLRKEMQKVEEERNKVVHEFNAIEETMKQQEHELAQLRRETDLHLAEKERKIKMLNNDRNDLNDKFSSLKEHADQQRKTIEHLFSVIDELYKLKNKPVNYIPPFCAAGNSFSSKNINFNKNKTMNKFGNNK